MVRVFLSYASEDRTVAEEIGASLRGAGHAVFVDRDSLPPGEVYDGRIAREIAASDLMVFLVSRNAVARGRYTLTELALASEQWPNANRRLLPVRIDTTPLDTLPAYARSVTLLEPQGSVAAEVTSTVDRFARMRRYRILRWCAIGLVVAAGLALGVGNVIRTSAPTSAAAMTIGRVHEVDTGLFGALPRFAVEVDLTNDGAGLAHFENFTVETRPAVGMSIANTSDSSPVLLRPGERSAHRFVVSGSGDAPGEIRFCWEDVGALSTCMPWRVWAPETRASQGGQTPPSDIGAQAHGAVATSGGILLLLGNPVRIVRFAAGVWAAPVAVTSAPTGARPGSISASGDERVLVATVSPSSLAWVHPTDPRQQQIVDVAALSGHRDAFDDPISPEIDAIAASRQVRWYRTGAGAGSPGLFHSSRNAWGWTKSALVSYHEGVAFDLDDLSLRLIDGHLWGAHQSTSPSSLLRFGMSSFKEWSGHSFKLLECAGDIGEHPSGLIIVDCDDRLKVVQPRDDDTVRVLGDLGQLQPWPRQEGWWETHLLMRTKDGVLVAQNRENVEGQAEAGKRTRLTLVKPNHTRILVESDRAWTQAIAAHGGWAVAVFRSLDDARDVRMFRVDG